MHPVVLFDGECNFCDSSVQFIIKHDPKGRFYFSSLQGDTGEKMREKYQIPSSIDSIVLIEDDKVYYKSTAALRICKGLSGFWKIFYFFVAVPLPLRNAVYDIIAKNRYKWFGKKESCMLPSPNIRKRFI
ncbi:thiol-disulfide oxidoreductase DCC family protein [Rummeliibacillus sp. G93]|uniref:thiol-disulfide oxidoreductase DCC family protein n=1 Tax=Rummeliibacillus TaxID=648802 RepID=UPI0011BFD6CE|nr:MULTISPECIES: thiol-disulfide oxidoreductase DCC family protein [Rummeliibacillus]MBB5171216.1 putative DCC family thiol-disulfide oxidoreductase YuxK [Rummeliibacillus stabekisii]MCM3317620.1 thiol-disulfide oxidoreductase DCC family protein [Rummeliibacillus stabekisii]UQW97388.1 thiol-disulfide oxidoreductase DCC family protein [Rummeliibacillus sp. G93]